MSDVGVLDAAEGRIAELMGVINAATAELVGRLGEVDRVDGWAEYAGVRSMVHWVTWQCGVSPRRAAGLLAIARRSDLPGCQRLFSEGALTEDAMAAIAARLDAGDDAEMAELAPALLHTQLVRTVASFQPKPPPPGEDESPVPEPEHRDVCFGVDGDRWRASLDLPLDEGALVEQAWTEARHRLFFDRHPDADPNGATVGAGVTWADAVVHAAELALRGAQRDWTRPADDRTQLIVHMDLHDAGRWAEIAGQDAPLPDTLRRYLACDATVRVVLTADGTPVFLSEKTRIVSWALRKLIERRDRGCRVPGCRQRRWLHIHHLRHWEDGGPTCVENLCALCPMHHRLHHAGLLAIDGDPTRPDGLTFTDLRTQQRLGARPPDKSRPPDPPPKPFQHPTGEPLDSHWLRWRNLN